MIKYNYPYTKIDKIYTINFPFYKRLNQLNFQKI